VSESLAHNPARPLAGPDPKETDSSLKNAKKPFRLAKYFSSFAVILIFSTCLILAALMSSRAQRLIYDRVVDDTIIIMENLNYQMYNNFLKPIYVVKGQAKLSEVDTYKFLHAVIQTTIHGFDISRVAIYDEKFGMMVYSSDSSVPVVSYELSPITREATPKGQLAEPMSSFQEALRRSLSSLEDQRRRTDRDRLRDRTVIVLEEGGYLLGGFFPRGRFAIRCFQAMEDYDTGKPSGVLELTRDLTVEYSRLASMQYMALAIAVFSSLFLSLVLWMVVARGESIINQKNNEQAALAERLHQTERLANLGQMVATVSHEIRNPLGIIRSSADFLASSLKSNQAHSRLAGAIVDESERLWGILTDFLDFARPQEPRFAPVVIEDIIEEILVLLEANLTRSGVELLTYLRPDPGPVLADAGLIHRALMNLLVNAIQAMPDGGLLTVATTLESEGEPTGNLIISIIDTGPGLSPEAASDLFKPFRTTKAKGTGLGLVLVRNVVESHGGKLQLVNVNGHPEAHGLRVTVTLPLKAMTLMDSPSLELPKEENHKANDDPDSSDNSGHGPTGQAASS
jgi:signal transduction histidine kinase